MLNRTSLRLTTSARPFHSSLRDFWAAQFTQKSHNIQRPKERLVILGAGWAGFKMIKKIDKTKYDVSLISPRNYFTFTPLLASTSVGTLEFRSAIEPVRQSVDLQFFEAHCKQIDVNGQRLTCTSALNGHEFTVDYDKLVIAVGAESNTFGIPGVKEHACFLKDISDARKIRQRLLRNLELASQPHISNKERKRLLHFAVVGGGPTGVEFCAELYDFVSDDISRKFPELRPLIQISLFDVAPKILGTFGSRLGSYATDIFRERGIHIGTSRAVRSVSEKQLSMANGEQIDYGLLVWSTGLRQNSLIEQLADVAKETGGMRRIVTDSRLRALKPDGSTALTNVYAIGDCATVTDYSLPCTAQVARQKAEYLSRQLNVDVGDDDVNLSASMPFKYAHKGSMAYVGGWKAIVDQLGGGEKQQIGTLAWLIWRGAYMSMADSWRNRIKIPTYWLLTWISGRETSRF